MNSLFLAWQDDTSRAWFPVGRLTYDGLFYRFAYVQGAREAAAKAGFQPIYSFPDFEQVYSSSKLFPLFANRLLRPSRPDYADFVQWLNLPGENDPLALLARSGGNRKTDTFEVFPCPERDEQGQYQLHFFAHGLRYVPPETVEHLEGLPVGQELWMSHEFQNPYDPEALALKTPDQYNLGYCPRYLVSEVKRLREAGQKILVTVERVNAPPTPLQFRILCRLTADWPEGFEPFSGESYQLLVNQIAA
ncbi:MAG: DNA-binding protein [Synechococcales cyanobacterium RM1_1_8]|nr:DNA-binding protein [Synechococcales cyanobacterium RM1_1_8]